MKIVNESFGPSRGELCDAWRLLLGLVVAAVLIWELAFWAI